MSEKIRDSFIFYRSFFQSTKRLSKEDKAELFDAICSYALDGELIELSAIPDAIFSVIQPNLDANRRRWENGCKEKKKSSEYKAKEEQSGSGTEAKQKQTLSKIEANKDKDKDVNVNKDDIKEISSLRSDTKKVFIKPTLQEVQSYCQERNNSVNPQKWMNHYESNGWKVGRNPMKDWKAAVRTWENNFKDFNNKPVSKHSNFEEQDYYAGTEGFLINDEEL